MLDYKKLMSLNPLVYESMTNSLGQKIDFVEHPTKGDSHPIICVCHELGLASDSPFFETDDMLADHKEYEPSFQEKDLYIGDFKN